jgi:DNA repair protein SbcD/Mre11
MRVIVCGDVHMGAVFGLGRPNGKGGNTRVDDYEESLNYVIDYVIRTKADIFVQTGDVFEFRDPEPEHMSIIDRALKRLSNANVASFVLMGNHDYKRNGDNFVSSISSLGACEYPNVRMVLNQDVIQVSNRRGERVNLLLLPYRDKRMFKGKNTLEQSKEYDSEVQSLIKTCESDTPIVAIGHNFFYEGSYSSYGGAEIMADPTAFSACDVVMMGHVHQFRVLRSASPACIYTGSMERSNFGDANVSKYLIDYSVEKKNAKFCKIPVRNLLDASCDLTDCSFSEILQELDNEISKLNVSEQIVRFRVLIDERVLPAVDRKDIQKKLYDAGAFYVSKVLVEVSVKRTIRDNEITKHKDDASMFKAFVKSQGIDKDYGKLLLKEAKKIMGAV